MSEQDQAYRYMYNEDETFKVEFSFTADANSVEFVSAPGRRKGVHKFWAEFHWPTYEQMALWRNACQRIDRATRMVIHNDAELDKIKVRHLLKQWSLKDEDELYELRRVPSCGCEYCRVQREKNILGVTSCLEQDSEKTVFGVKIPIVSQLVVEMNLVVGT